MTTAPFVLRFCAVCGAPLPKGATVPYHPKCQP
jgi:hypothetical protein